MSDDRPGGRLASTERGEVIAFGAFVLVLVTTVGIVVIAREGWSGEQWAAVAALAAVVQTVVLTVALVFAWKQVSTTQQIAERERQRIVVDRIVEAFDDLEPEVSAFAGALRTIVHLRELADSIEDPNTEQLKFLARGRDEALAELSRSKAAADASVRRLRRHLDAIGRGGIVTSYALQMEMMQFDRWAFRDPEAEPGSDAIEESAERVSERLKQARGEIREFVSRVAATLD